MKNMICFVSIPKGVDKNMCCGTHIHNLSDLQVGVVLFKLFYREKNPEKLNFSSALSTFSRFF